MSQSEPRRCHTASSNWLRIMRNQVYVCLPAPFTSGQPKLALWLAPCGDSTAPSQPADSGIFFPVDLGTLRIIIENAANWDAALFSPPFRGSKGLGPVNHQGDVGHGI